MHEDREDNGRVGEEGEDLHVATTRWAEQRQHLVDASEQHGPTKASGVPGSSRFRIDGGLRRWTRELGGECVGLGPADERDGGAELGIGSEHPVIPMPLYTGGWHETSEPLEELVRREQELGAPVGRRLGQPIDEEGLGRGKGNDAAGGMEPFKREGWTCTVSEQLFDACSVLALDTDGRVDTEPTGALPRQHAVGVGLVEQAVAVEVAEHATLDDVLKLMPVLGNEPGRLMEADVAVGRVREHTIEHDESGKGSGLTTAPLP